MLYIKEYFFVSMVIFLLGMIGIILNRKNLIIMLMSIELLLLAINLAFITFSVHLGDVKGQIISLFILTVAAAESAIGLAILVAYYRVRGTIEVQKMNRLKG
jgi:NADH-quinone oxidoreductase subunit K